MFENHQNAMLYHRAHRLLMSSCKYHLLCGILTSVRCTCVMPTLRNVPLNEPLISKASPTPTEALTLQADATTERSGGRSPATMERQAALMKGVCLHHNHIIDVLFSFCDRTRPGLIEHDKLNRIPCRP